MSDPASQPRRVLLATLVLVALVALVVLLWSGHLVAAVVAGAVAVAVLVAAARPTGARRS